MNEYADDPSRSESEGESDRDPVAHFNEQVTRVFGAPLPPTPSSAGTTPPAASPSVPASFPPEELGIQPAPWLTDPAAAPPAPSPPPEPSAARHAGPVVWIALIAFLLAGTGVGAYFIVAAATGPSAASTGTVIQSDAAAPVTAPSSDAQSPAQEPIDDSTTSSTTGRAEDVVAQLDDILDQSASARSGVQSALDRIASCAADDSDVSVLSQAGITRRALADDIDSVDFDSFGDGSSLMQALNAVLTTSADADDAYAQWGMNQSGCSGGADQDASKQEGDSYSEDATAAKRTFLRLWNPIAKSYGYSARSESEI